MRIIKSSRQFTARHFFHEDGVCHRDLEQDRVPARKFKRFNPQSFEKDFVPLSQNALSDPAAAGRTGRFCFVLNCSGTRVACEIFLSAAGTAASTTVVARVSRARMNFFSQLAPGVAMLLRGRRLPLQPEIHNRSREEELEARRG